MSSIDNLDDEDATPQPIQTPHEKVVQAFQSQPFGAEKEKDKAIVSILKDIHFFAKNLEVPIKLDDFVKMAKLHLKYEVHSYGTVIFNEKEYADKFYILLKGNVKSFRSRRSHHIEREVVNSNSKKTTPQAKYDRRPQILGRKQHNQQTLSTLQNKEGSIVSSYTPTLEGFITEISEDMLPTHSTENIANGTLPNGHSRRGHLKSNICSSFNELDEQISNILPTSESSMQGSTYSLTPKAKTFKAKDGASNHFSGHLANKKISSTLLKTDRLRKKNVNACQNSIIIEGRENTEDEPQEKKPLLDKEDVDLIQYITSKSTEMKDKYFMNDNVRITRTAIYSSGDHFGESFCKQPPLQEKFITVTASEEVHLLSLKREDYLTIVDELRIKADEKVNIFSQLFPFLIEEDVKELSQYFEQKCFKKGEVIYSQGESARELYLLHNGNIRLYKEIGEVSNGVTHSISSCLASHKHARKIELPIASVVKNQFFGEEFLLREKQRKFTAISQNSNIIVYALDIHSYKEAKEKFQFLLKSLKEQAKERFTWRNQRVLELAIQQRLPFQSSFDHEQSRSTRVSNSMSGHSFVTHGINNLYFPIKDSSFSFEAKQQTSRDNSSDHQHLVQETNNFETENTSASKNLQVYKTRFSRKVKETFKSVEDKYLQKDEETNQMVFLKEGLPEFNIRKELDSPKPTKLKLPRVASNEDLSLKKGQETTKSLYSKIPKLHSLSPMNRIKNQEHEKSVGLDYSSICGSMMPTPKEMKKKKTILGAYIKSLASSNDYGLNGIIEKRHLRDLNDYRKNLKLYE